MVNRPDHIARILPVAERPQVETFHVPADLLEHLEATFQLTIPANTYPATMDQMVETSQGVTFYNGQRSVIDYMKGLARASQGE